MQCPGKWSVHRECLASTSLSALLRISTLAPVMIMASSTSLCLSLFPAFGALASNMFASLWTSTPVAVRDAYPSKSSRPTSSPALGSPSMSNANGRRTSQSGGPTCETALAHPLHRLAPAVHGHRSCGVREQVPRRDEDVLQHPMSRSMVIRTCGSLCCRAHFYCVGMGLQEPTHTCEGRCDSVSCAVFHGEIQPKSARS